LTHVPKSSPAKKGGGQSSIRDDLWKAMMDLSGRQYVWDQSEGIARSARSGDKPPYFPTMTRAELTQWRTEFAQSVTGGLSADQIALVRRWAKENLRTNVLPAQLQPRWNREMTRRARLRLMEFFGAIRRSAEINLPDASATADREPEVVDEIAAARDAGDFFSVGELLATKLHSADVQAAGPLLARIVAAWAAPKGPLVEAASPIDLLARLESISEENAAVALVNAVRRLRSVEVIRQRKALVKAIRPDCRCKGI
jgi:hypothetical protein